MNKRVSVICATNRLDELFFNMLESVKKQDYDNIEVIVVLDGQVAFDNRLTDRNIKVLKNDKPLGLTASLNKAIAESAGYYIARVDAKDICEPDRISRQVLYLEGNGIDIVSCNVDVISENGRLVKIVKPPSTHEAIIKRMPRHNCFVHSSILVKKEVLQAVGSYNERFIYAQDYDLYLRLILKGCKFGVSPEILLHKRIDVRSTTMSKRRWQICYAMAAQSLYFAKAQPKNPLSIFFCILSNLTRFILPIKFREIRINIWNR